MVLRWFALLVIVAFPFSKKLKAESDANRLAYLDGSDPFYAGLNFARLTTPQWVGESDVQAVVILAIDDMREPQKYEIFLRPILERLKQIDGRAPVSIFCNQLDPRQPQLQTWLKEGLSLEVHTLTHPCPLLANNDFSAAATNYHDCVDLLNQVPGNRPVAFRMPCCDSMNSPSPRFYAEMFNRVSSGGRFLTMDSSVMNLTTANDKSLPRELVLDPDGREKFRKYFPTGTNTLTKLSLKSFGTTIEDYPYPYIVGKLCWEFPPMVPSDWEANNAHGPTNAATVADWKAALDVAVRKQGVFTFIFHPHGWIRPGQLVEFIDHADKQYGTRVKFLNFREAEERLDKNLLLGRPLRAVNGQDNGVRLLDLNNDGYLDVIIGNGQTRKTRLWNPKKMSWIDSDFPTALVVADRAGDLRETGIKFGVVSPDSTVTMIERNESVANAWRFDGTKWVEDKSFLSGLEIDSTPVFTSLNGRDRGVRLRDVDNDGNCEVIVSNDKQNAMFAWSAAEKTWRKSPYALPAGTSIVDDEGRDNGLRFVDVNADGYDDVLFSNDREFALYLYIATPRDWLGWQRGWSFKIAGGRRGDPGELPMIVRGGTNRNNGVWFHSNQMFVQNEDTSQPLDKVDRHSFAELLTIAEPPPKSPEASLATIRVRPGFKAELVASEPLVVDPAAFDWGPDGKLWVVEMRDYPLGLDGHGKPGGVIKFLEDTDGDGRYDKATVFLDSVNFPNGIMAWRNGVLVSAAPEVFYAEDTDGDGKADIRKPILVGFNQGNQQHRVNGFEYGLDNWVYLANGDSGGMIRSVLTGKSANARGHDLRFKPDTGEFELVEGQTQFGRRRDDWGNWFGNENPTWLWHYYLPEHYLKRNSELTAPSMKRVLANYPKPTRAFPISRAQQRFNWPDAVNNVTSANSATPYRDRLFGPDFATSVFVSEPAQNLVHREVLESDGVTFTSHRAAEEQDREFLASTDNWFRPAQLKIGPDGALYIADVYRLVIEHPEYFPEELKHRPDLRAGDDKGRIYRVYPEGAKLRPIPRLDRLGATDLIQSLTDVNGWERDMAQKLLVWRKKTVPAPRLLQAGADAHDPKARIQVLSTLEGLGLMTPMIASSGLRDPEPYVRAFALRLCEPFLKASSTNEINEEFALTLLDLVSDSSIRVRYQLAFTLGDWEDPRASQALTSLALKDRDDQAVQTAVLSSAPGHVDKMIESIFAIGQKEPPPAALLSQLLRMATVAGDFESVSNVLNRLARPDGNGFASWQMETLAGFLDALERRSLTLKAFRDESSPELKTAVERLGALFQYARSLAGESQASEPDRLGAIGLLGRGLAGREEDVQSLAALLGPNAGTSVQEAALGRLKQINDPAVAKAMLITWNSLGPAMRTEAMNVLLSRPQWVRELLMGMKSGTVTPAEVSPVHRQRLLKHSDADIRERAQQLFETGDADRQQILKQYASVNDLTGHPESGALLYRANCSVCHRLKGEGNNVGPDLGTVADKPVGTLLVAILDPNQAFEARYINYTAITRNGREVNGIIAVETPNSITLRNAGGADETIFRSDIKELTSSKLSLMPEGFENNLKPQDMADLIAFIRSR